MDVSKNSGSSVCRVHASARSRSPVSAARGFSESDFPAEPHFLKFKAPEAKRMVHRGRLIKRLEENAGCRIVIITGQAAQGKTTLAADYLKGSKYPTAWMHLDREDGEAVNFYILLLHALNHAGIRGIELTDLIEPPGVVLGKRHEQPRFKAGIRSAFNRIGGSLNLVLDSVEAIPSDAPSLDLLQFILDQTPPGVRFFLISRQIPTLRLHDLKVKREAFWLKNDDLAFDRNEIGKFFQCYHEIDLEEKHLDRLCRMTGGWTGGLVLISQALLHLEVREAKDYIMNGLPMEIRSETLQYFSEVIFSNEPSHVRDFLIKTAIFDEIDPEIAAEMTGVEESDAVFERMVRRNLFIQRYNDSRHGISYRYNQMFMDFLRSLFRAKIPSKEQKNLFLKAGNLYSARRRREDAVGFFILGGDFDSAAEAIKRIGVDMCIRGRFQELEGWLESLPKITVENDPWLFLLLTLTRRFKGGRRSLRDFQIVLKRFKKRGDLRGRILTLAYLIEAAVFQEHDLKIRRRWLEEARRLLETLGSISYYTYARTLLWLQIGFGCISGGLDVQKGLSASRNAYLLASKMGASALRANAGIVCVLGYATAGEFTEAEKVMDRVRPLMGRDPCPEYIALQNLINAELHLKKGELERAAQMMISVREEIETYGLLFLYPEFLYAQGQVYIRRGEYEKSTETIHHLFDAAAMSGNLYHRGLAQRLEATALFFQKSYERAQAAAENALTSFRETAGETIHLMRIRLMLGLIFLESKKFEKAKREFECAMAFFKKNGNTISIAETHLCLGLTAYESGRPDNCRANFLKGFQIASKAGYRHFTVLRPADLLRACSLAASLDDADCVEYAKGLLTEVKDRREKQNDPADTAPLLVGHPVGSAGEPDPKSEEDGFAANHGFLKIYTFGGFRARLASRGWIGARQWGGRRSKMLLQAIVVHGGRDIPSNVLTEDLWPESSEKAARRNLKVTLHRLRKALEPDLDHKRGSAYLHLKDNLVSLDTRLCRTDVDEFLQCCRESRLRESASEPEKVLKLSARAAEIYAGDFLPEEPYEPWIEMKRLALKDDYINVLFRMAEILGKIGNLHEAVRCCAKILKAEPCLERANRMLMRLYAMQGRKAEALKTFENFKKRLIEDIGIEPDVSTVKLYHRIRSRRL